MKQTKISINLDGLEEMRKGIGDLYRARVGILGQYAARTGETEQSINNATLGLIQMYGSVTNKIPPRDFLVMPIERKRRELLKVLGSSTARAAFAQKDFKRLFMIIGATAAGFVDEAFASAGFGTWAPNKPATVARKGSSAPLIDTAELRKSISFDVVSKNFAQLPAVKPLKPLEAAT